VSISETLNETPLSSLDLTRYVTVDTDATMADTVRSMADAGESCAIVMDRHDLVGIFTQRDALRVIGRPSKWDRPITDEMTKRVRTIGVDGSVSDGLAIMTDWWVRSVPVLDADDELVGNLSFYTIMQVIADIVAMKAASSAERSVQHRLAFIDFTGLNTNTPVTVSADETVDVVTHHMRARAIGSVLVVDDRENLIGIVTEYDLLKKLGCDVEDAASVAVNEVMTPKPFALSARSSLAEAIGEMAALGCAHVPLLGESGRPVGVASFRDLAAYFEGSVAVLT
jgi:CBS domain-containing protein